jgi:hypothetical protein
MYYFGFLMLFNMILEIIAQIAKSNFFNLVHAIQVM